MTDTSKMTQVTINPVTVFDQIEKDVTFEGANSTQGVIWTATYRVPELAAYAPIDQLSVALPLCTAEEAERIPLRDKYNAVLHIASTVAFIRQHGAEHYRACLKIGAI